MRDGDRRDGTPKHDKGIKKPRTWPDHFSWMVGYARKLVGSNDAEDIANKALYDACRPDRPRPPIDSDETRGLLRHLIWLRAREHWRNQKRHRHETPGDRDFEIESHPLASDKRSDVMLERIVLERALVRLNPTDRQLVLGYYLSGFTADELAQTHNMNESTVRSRITRSVTKLTEALEDGRRQTRTCRSGLFLLELVFGRFGEMDIMTKMSEWFVSLAKPVRGLAACTLSMMPLALIPSDRIDIPDPRHMPPEPHHVPIWDGGERMTAPVFDTTHAHPDRLVPPSNAIVRKKRKSVTSVPIMPAANATIEITSPLKTSAPKENEPRSRDDYCGNAFGLALVKSNAAEPGECLAILERHRVGAEACPETLEWSRLRRKCARQEAMNKP